MATLPTMEEIERAILDIFEELNVRAGRGLLLQALSAQWPKSFTQEELLRGLASLVAKRYIEQSQRHHYILTEQGYAAI